MERLKQGATEELVYAQAIPILAGDLYPRKLEIVREYIQNASDALDAFSRIAEHIDDDSALQIKVSIQGRSLLIWDNGIGMDDEEIGKLKRIAYSEKREAHEAGHKGIGRLAGIAVASKLVMSSTSYGDGRLHKFEFRAKALIDELNENRRKGIQEAASLVINRHTSISSIDVDPADHYTMVELWEIDDKYPELLDPSTLREFIGDIGPVGFAPHFEFGERISNQLRAHVPEYSPKTIWLTTATGERLQIYKPYNNAMKLAEPEFIEVLDPREPSRPVAYCWYATKGLEMLNKIRPAGRRFTVDAATADARKRFAGVVYKLFGFSIGDRNLPLSTLWSKDYTRALWFTGEIHVLDKRIRPTTDRAEFVESEPRKLLYDAATVRIAKRLDQRAQDISNNRKAWEIAKAKSEEFERLNARLADGRLDRTEVNRCKQQVDAALGKELKRKCKDRDVQDFLRAVTKEGQRLQRGLREVKSSKRAAKTLNDIMHELRMTSQARKVYAIVMETIESYFAHDKDTCDKLSSEIRRALKRRY